MSDDSIRLDKWLWFARFLKTRTLAAQLCRAGRVRLNKTPVSKANAQIKPGDVLAFPLSGRVRVVRVLAVGTRRGPAPEAQALYEDLSPATPPPRPPRPSKRDRREIIRLKAPR